MPYEEGLAERIRGVLDAENGITEKKMFGGIAFLRRGKMFVGIVKNDLMVRVGPDGYTDALNEALRQANGLHRQADGWLRVRRPQRDKRGRRA